MSGSVATGQRLLGAEIDEAHAQGRTRIDIPNVSPHVAWKIFADTDLLNRAIGNPEIDVCNIPVRPGLARRVLTTREAQPVTYEEEHYQWEEGRWHGGRRFFVDIPLEKFLFLFRAEPSASGSVVEARFGFWGRGDDGKALAATVAQGLSARVAALGDVLRTAHQLAHPRFVLPPRHEQRLDRVQLRVLTAALVDSGEDPDVVAALARHLETADDKELAHMAPLELARDWQRQADPVIDAFVRAARLALLVPQWSVACPSCRGAKGITTDIAELAARPVHCDDCNISFDVDPTQNMALTFTPAPVVRRIEETFTCIAGPTRTPHIKGQIYLPPGATMRLAVPESPDSADALWLGCPDINAAVRLERSGGRYRRYRIDEGQIVDLGETSGVTRDAVEIVNGTGARVRVRLEDRAIADTFLRASMVLDRPRFRELFGTDQWEFLCTMERAWRSAFGFAALDVAPAEAERHYDLIVVGSGPGGEAAALRAAQLGKHVALIESSAIFGGPSGLASKAMREAVRKIVAWADAAMDDRRTSDPARRLVRLRTLFEQRSAVLRRYVASLQMQDVLQRLTRAGARLHRGTGSFGTDGQFEVRRLGGDAPYRLSGTAVVLATGSRPARPSGVPFDGIHVLDATDMGDLERLPRTLCIIGAGVIGSEFATIMAALGVRVTLVVGRRAVFPFLDQELTRAGLDQMRRSGINIVTDAAIADVTVDDGAGAARAAVTTRLEDGTTIKTDLVLYAEGRDANTQGLACELAGIKLGRHGQITVDSAHRTANPTVFAVGDVIGPPGLASSAAEQGKAVAELLFRAGAHGDRATAAAHTLWTLPEIAGVGLTEETARAQTIDYAIGRAHFRDLPRGILSGEISGWLKLLVDRESRRLLGVHIIGESACELIHYGRALVDGRSSVDELAQTTFSAMTFHGLYQAAAEDALVALDGSRSVIP